MSVALIVNGGTESSQI